MKSFKVIIALLLVFAMVLPVLTACGDDTGSDDGQGGGTALENVGGVPDDVTFDGETYTILCRTDNAWGKFLHEIEADEDATDVVNQAVYDRNLAVEERFGITIDANDISGHWNQKDEFINTFKNSILSGDGAFDLIMSQQAYMAELGLTDLYINFYDVPYLKDDLDAEYFYQDMVDELTVNGKLYYLVGDYCLTYWEYLYVLYFNKQIAEDQRLEDIYQLVRDGTWTIDKCIEMATGVYSDINGNGYVDDGDRFGYITDYQNTADALFSEFDVQATSKDESGNVVLDIDQGKMVSILEKMIAFYQTDDVVAIKSSGTQAPEELPYNVIFTEDRALFYPERLDRAQLYRGMETDFGIVPYPKWNESQGGYYTQSQNGYSVAVVPLDAPNLEMTGAVLDVLMAESYRTVIPAYYDMALKDKFARDDESGEMLDIVREGIKVNFGYFYYVALGTGGIIRLLLEYKNSNFVSYYAANQRGYERNLKKILDSYANEAE